MDWSWWYPVVFLVAVCALGGIAAWLSKLNPSYGNAAQIASAFVAATAFGIIWWQVHQNGNYSRQASARQIYMSYMNALLQYPNLTRPNPQTVKAMSGADKEQYVTFVGYMLTAYDEIFASIPDHEWNYSFEDDVSGHLYYLCAGTYEYLRQYYVKTIEAVDRARATVQGDCKIRKFVAP